MKSMASMILWVIVVAILVACPAIIVAALSGMLTISVFVILFAPVLLLAGLVVKAIKKLIG